MAKQFCFDLKQIADEQTVKGIGEILLESLAEDNTIAKQIVKDFFTKCLRNIKDDKVSPELKFNTLSILRFLDFKNKQIVKVFSTLSGHPIYPAFIQFARNVDPKKPIREKGKALFPQNAQIGNKFMRLLLESLKYWSQIFSTNHQQQPTKYKKNFKELEKQGVIFPTNYEFYKQGNFQQKSVKQPLAIDKPKKNKVSSSQEQQKTIENADITPEGPKEEKVTKSSIMLLFNKIQTFTGFLEDSQSIEQVQRQVNKLHKFFQKQQKRLQKSNIFTIEDEKILALYLKINEFFLTERDIFEEWMAKQYNLQMYVESLLIKYDEIFAEQIAEQNREPEQKPQKQKKQLPPSKQQQITKTINIKNNEEKKQKAYESSKIQKQKPLKKSEDNQEDKPRQWKSALQNSEIKDKGLRTFFESHLQRPSKKSLSGFKSIQVSIQKQKKELHSKVRSKGPINSQSKSKFNASTVSKIKLDSIFAKPPNQNVRSKRYEGTLVSMNFELLNSLYEIQKQQSLRRFKISNLKDRALLYESEYIQVGYKDEALYQKIQGLKAGQQMIQFQLFIGNKTDQKITDFQVVFIGDQRSLVYSNPQRAPQTLKKGEQCLFNVLIIPSAQNYGPTTMKIEYRLNSHLKNSVCTLPSSIIKFVAYRKADVREMKEYESVSIKKSYQTERFQLSHYFPPRKIQHYIEQVTEMTSYSDFVENGSEKDFVLGSFFTIKKKYSGLLKINVRPNLDVVIQILSDNQTSQAQQHFIFYLQTLEMIFKQYH